VAIGVLVSGICAAPAQAAAPRVFKNCTELNKTYKGGVAMPGAKDKRKSGRAKYTPKYDKALYQANRKSDRDGDKIACEK
jgi:hypothetical protein